MRIINSIKSADGITTKYCQLTSDGHPIETVYVNHHNKHIICFSTQIGCLHGCKFCYNGIKNNFIRNLTKNELLDQIYNVKQHIDIFMDKPILYSAMGVGEPFANYDNLIAAIKTIAFTSPYARFAISTNGSYPKLIRKLSADLILVNMKLMVSLHTVNPETRLRMMPLCSNINELLDSCLYFENMHHAHLEYNVILMDGINDSDEDAIKLCKLLNMFYVNRSPHIKINKFNLIPNCDITESHRKDRFINILKSMNMDVEEYSTDGSDIGAACGQLC